MLTFFFLPVCFKWSHLNGSVWFVQKRNKAAIVQLACENCAKHEDLLPAWVDFYLGNWTDPRAWQLQQKRDSEPERHLHCSWSVQSSISTSESKSECPVKSVSGVLEKLFSAPSSSKVSVLE